MIRDLNIRQVKNELRQARQQLACRIGVRDEAHVEQVADAMDQIQAAEAREFALLNLDRYARQLRQVEDALQRIDAGDYGVCVDCEEEIGLNRITWRTERLWRERTPATARKKSPGARATFPAS